MNINKILEIDLDTERAKQMLIFQQSRTARSRERQPDDDWNLLHNAIILINALAGTVVSLESQGFFPKGGAMRYTVDKLQEAYVDASLEVKEVKFDTTGSIIP